MRAIARAEPGVRTVCTSGRLSVAANAQQGSAYDETLARQDRGLECDGQTAEPGPIAAFEVDEHKPITLLPYLCVPA